MNDSLFPGIPAASAATSAIDLNASGDWVVHGAYRRDELDVADMDDLGECYLDSTLGEAAKLWADTNDPQHYNWSPGSKAYVYAALQGGGTLYLVRLRMRTGEHGTGDAVVLSATVEGSWKG